MLGYVEGTTDNEALLESLVAFPIFAKARCMSSKEGFVTSHLFAKQAFVAIHFICRPDERAASKKLGWRARKVLPTCIFSLSPQMLSYIKNREQISTWKTGALSAS